MQGFSSSKKRKRYADGGQVKKDESVASLPVPLGTGAAANAGKALLGRQAQLDAAIDGYANGGKVVGPGTGISDDVPAEVPEGSYIMPADSTAQIGDQALAGMGQPVPVNLSNGEFQMPPEQVHAVGVQALDQMKNATHAPVDRLAKGFQPAGAAPEQFFANGGPVFSGVDPDELGRSNTPKRAVIPKAAPNFHVDASGTATKSLPSPSRAVVPYQGPGTQLTTTAQPRPAPAAAPKADFYGNSRGATGKGFQPSSSTAVTPSGPVKTHQQPPGPAPAARPALEAPKTATPPYEPDYKTRAESKARASKDTAAFEADRAKQDARFNQAAAEGQRAPAASGGGARGFINKAGKGGALLAAVPAIAAATDEDSTARYAERFGVDEPTGDGSLGDIAKFTALRAGGFASDLGSSLTLGLADGLYRDKQQVDTQLLGAGAGAVAGGAAGSKIAPMIGRGVDKAAGFVSRGRYKGDAAERLGKKIGTVGGAVAGGSAGASIGEQEGMPSAEAQTQAQGGGRTAQAVIPGESAGFEPVWSRTGVDNVAGRIGSGGVPEFSNDADVYAGAGDLPEGGFADTRGAGGQPGAMTAPDGARVLASGSSVEGGNEGVGSMANIGNGIGGLSYGEAGDAQLAYDRNERAIEERQKMIEVSRRGEIGEGGGRVTVVRDSSREPTRAERLNAAMERGQSLTEATRAQTQLGFNRDSREQSAAAQAQQAGSQQIQLGDYELADRQRIQLLYDQYQSAQPEERSAISEQIRAITGKEQAARFTVVPGGQAVNPDGTTYTLPSAVINNQTGEFMQQPGSSQPATSYPVGTRSTHKNGKVAVWDGSQWVPQ